MKKNRRTAQYISTLVYADGPQLILLRAHKTNIVAMAIPSGEGEALFIATSVTGKIWESYLDGHVDLRFLFVHASVRTTYSFDLMKLKDNKIRMDPWEGSVDERFLPSPRFFSVNHTEEDPEDFGESADSEVLYVDGEWDMPDFGSFYSRYSDVYYFLSSANEYEDEETPDEVKRSIERAFRDKAFKGGFSYVHLYDAIASNRGRGQRLGVDKIKYESPGYINVNGEKESFAETKSAIKSFLVNKGIAKKTYDELYLYLSKAKLLTLDGDNYPDDHGSAPYIRQKGVTLAHQMELENYEAIDQLVEGNTLVFVKVIMSFYRRLDEATKFFAQGRVNFA